MRLYQKAKQTGTWDPRRLDLTQDARDWAGFTVAERDVLVRLTALFQAAEESMTHDLVPLLMTVMREDQVEDEFFLTTFLADEAKHTEFFRRILDEVCGQSGDLLRYQTPSFRKVFWEKLPNAMEALRQDAAPKIQAAALVIYTLVGEGVLGEAGYHVFGGALDRRGIMPGYREGLRLAQADEDRHMAYGIFRLSRLLTEDGGVWDVISDTMDDLIPDTLGVVTEFFDPYDPAPFGLSLQSTVEYAMEQFATRWQTLEEVRERSRQAARLPPEDEAVRQVFAWVRDQAGPAPVDMQRDDATAIYTLRVGPEGGAALLITRDVLAHHSSAEIIAALDEHRVPGRWPERAGRMTCLRVGGKIVVQALVV